MKHLLLATAVLIAACQPAADNQSANDDSFVDNGGTPAAPVDGSPGAPPAAAPDTPPAQDGDEPAPPSAPEPPATPSPPAPAPPPAQPGGCAIVRSSDWNAVVNAMPGPNSRPALIVTGEVVTATGGYRPVLRLGQVNGSPARVIVRLDPRPPSGPASQALVTHEVRGRFAVTPPVASVTVRCGGRVLARISPVETAY